MKEMISFNYNTIASTGYANYYTTTSGLPMQIGNFAIVNNTSEMINVEDTGKYSVVEIANWFLHKSSMTHKKLQKLCYYAQAWSYALNGIRLADTDFQAWVHGPVSPILYEKFKTFGYDVIKLAGEYVCHIEEKDVELLEDVWETYGGQSGNALEALTHREIPWLEARRGYANNERCTIAISPESMISYYKSIYAGE